jgi:hypothetical protein
MYKTLETSNIKQKYILLLQFWFVINTHAAITQFSIIFLFNTMNYTLMTENYNNKWHQQRSPAAHFADWYSSGCYQEGMLALHILQGSLLISAQPQAR